MEWYSAAVIWLVLGFIPGYLVARLVDRRARRKAAPSFRKVAPEAAPQEPDAHRNLTAEAATEERPGARQTQARFHPRVRNYTTRGKS